MYKVTFKFKSTQPIMEGTQSEFDLYFYDNPTFEKVWGCFVIHFYNDLLRLSDWHISVTLGV